MTDKRRKLDEGQVVEIIEIYAASGTTYRQIAARYGVSAQTISDIIRRKKWTSVNAPSAAEMQALMPRARGKARALEIIDRYAAGGVTQAELAAEYGLATQSVGNIIAGKTWGGIDAPRPAERRAARNAEIAARYAAGGVTQAELAAEYDLGLSTINRIIRCSRAATAGAVPHR